MPFHVRAFDKVTDRMVEKHLVDPKLSAADIWGLFGFDADSYGEYEIDEEGARLLQPYVSARIDIETYDCFLGETAA